LDAYPLVKNFTISNEVLKRDEDQTKVV